MNPEKSLRESTVGVLEDRGRGEAEMARHTLYCSGNWGDLSIDSLSVKYRERCFLEFWKGLSKVILKCYTAYYWDERFVKFVS